MNPGIIFLVLIIVWGISHIIVISTWAGSTPEEFKSMHNFFWTRLNIFGKIIMWLIYFLICPFYTFIRTCNYLFVKKEYRGE